MTYRKVVFKKDAVDRTHQSFKAECDISTIMKKYRRTGLLPQRTDAQYGDFIDVPGYHDAMNRISEAQAAFDDLPASLRKRFNHDPANFLEFVHNADNKDEMRSLGLLKPEVSAPNVAPLPASDAVIS